MRTSLEDSPQETEELITDLLNVFTGEQGRDSLGTPLLDREKVSFEWESQKKHVVCLQDPPGVQLYTKTGSIKKGGVELPVYRCARGSVSLESFHLHLTRFVPATTASDAHMQAYLLEGLVRWNEDRATAASSDLKDAGPQPHSYSGLLKTACNRLYNDVFGEKLVEAYTPPMKYTGTAWHYIKWLENVCGKLYRHYKT